MGRTDWGGVIIGGSALIGIAYVFFNWKTICPQVLGAEKCSGGLPGLFGGTLTGSGIGQGYGQLYTNPTTGQKQVINPSIPVAGASSKANVGASLGTGVRAPKTTKTTRTPPKKTATAASRPTEYYKPANTTANKNTFCADKNNKINYPNICGQCPAGTVRNKLTGNCNKPITGSNYTNAESYNTYTLNRLVVR